MAKKGQALQLQTEVSTDEEWEKLLHRDGLILVDVYSEWCGPCVGMMANLKKLKLEIGGDLLQLAIAKSDTIKVLERFRNKSEPTWMFIVNGKMVNLTFGANAPALIQLITNELKKEEEARAGKRQRVEMEITELSPEEKIRYEIIESKIRAEVEAEERKKAQELYERRVLECNNILEKFGNVGVILVFPHARTKYQEALSDLLQEAALIISTTEKVTLTDEIIEHLTYFGKEPPFDDENFIKKNQNDICIALYVKQSRNAAELEVTIEDLLSKIVYGPSKKPPGDPDSPADFLSKLTVQTNDDNEQNEPLIGIWTPTNSKLKAVCLKLFFTALVEALLVPEPEPIPPHFAIAFDPLQRKKIAKLINKYPKEILNYGFFTDTDPNRGQLFAKTYYRYEKNSNTTFKEHLVLKLSKKKSECVLAFSQSSPTFISSTLDEGKRICKAFFPDNYLEDIGDEEKEFEQNILLAADAEEIAIEPSEEEGEEKVIEEGEAEGEEEGEEDEKLAVIEYDELIGEEGYDIDGTKGKLIDETMKFDEQNIKDDAGGAIMGAN